VSTGNRLQDKLLQEKVGACRCARVLSQLRDRVRWASVDTASRVWLRICLVMAARRMWSFKTKQDLSTWPLLLLWSCFTAAWITRSNRARSATLAVAGSQGPDTCKAARDRAEGGIP